MKKAKRIYRLVFFFLFLRPIFSFHLHSLRSTCDVLL
jgi:hypothetical protein